jgi:hypothetical protein
VTRWRSFLVECNHKYHINRVVTLNNLTFITTPSQCRMYAVSTFLEGIEFE